MSWRTWVRCEVGMHTYDRWVDGSVYTTKVRNFDAGAGVIEGVPYWIGTGNEMVQTRVCRVCGVKQSRSVEV